MTKLPPTISEKHFGELDVLGRGTFYCQQCKKEGPFKISFYFIKGGIDKESGYYMRNIILVHNHSIVEPLVIEGKRVLALFLSLA